MRTIKRTISVSAALAIAVVAFAGVAGAQTDDEAATGQATISGRGWLWAVGRGDATLDMGGKLRMLINGDVEINDVEGDMSVRIVSEDALFDDDPEGEDLFGPEAVLNDFEGGLVVTGTHFVVEASGTMHFFAQGHGVADLEGTGLYKTRKMRIPRTWSHLGTRLELGAA